MDKLVTAIQMTAIVLMLFLVLASLVNGWPATQWPNLTWLFAGLFFIVAFVVCPTLRAIIE